MRSGSDKRIPDCSPSWLSPRIIKVGCLPRFRLLFLLKSFFADICNQLLDFYDEIERQNAVSAQAAVVSNSEQQPACASSQRADAVPMATLPDLKVQRLSAFFSVLRRGNAASLLGVDCHICTTGKTTVNSVDNFGCRRSFLPGYDIDF